MYSILYDYNSDLIKKPQLSYREFNERQSYHQSSKIKFLTLIERYAGVPMYKAVCVLYLKM